ncbi:metal ABC transporter ATP-binding protein [Maridesulfovibrio salexigens]|uniref:ABC transporter related n=1 Tax=Maridesulfovibrio salexigens (strain ATCC 14822 / DSM 2638 / NCIMB 8403 / VKM B-1763) TaxID=526222 RepID=C6C0C4_MARSD|nr:metal ABC transporter ATP-binding protein [Maridesulfovibrio salexigens]ACS79058.1 ABC transporter related [Maridesulfovibrio salexigens DSM 2638]
MNTMLKAKCGPSINFENVSLTLGNTRILKNLNFEIHSGALHCIVGPNGGGKTSLLRSLLGQMPHSGNISIEWHENRTIGYVPQTLNYDTTLPITVENFMSMTCQNRPAFMNPAAKDWKAIRTALELVNMAGKSKRIFGQLSGGERQRVLLAQALLPEPSLLILDEPTTGLDKAGAAIMRSLLQELKAKGVTILIIHHDLMEVKEIGDCVTCINREILFSGCPTEELSAERIMSIFSSARQAA